MVIKQLEQIAGKEGGEGRLWGFRLLVLTSHGNLGASGSARASPPSAIFPSPDLA